MASNAIFHVDIYGTGKRPDLNEYEQALSATAGDLRAICAKYNVQPPLIRPED